MQERIGRWTKCIILAIEWLITHLIISIPSLIILLILIYFLWINEQGKDAIIDLDYENSISGYTLLCGALIVLGFFNTTWIIRSNYLLAKLHRARLGRDWDYIFISIFGHLPALLVGLAVYNTYSKLDPLFFISFVLFILVLFAIVLKIFILPYLRKNPNEAIFITSILIFSCLASLLIRNRGLALISPFLIYITAIIISYNFVSKSPGNATLRFKIASFINSRLRWINLLLVLIFLILALQVDSIIPPIIAVVYSLFFLLSVTYFINHLIIKSRTEHNYSLQFGLGAALILGLMLYSTDKTNKNHIFHIDPASDQHKSARSIDRAPIDEHIKSWVFDKIELDTTCQKKHNIVLVNSYGGGIRATIWTNMVLSKIMENTNEKLKNDLLSITGSSGGMIGAGIFFASLDSPQSHKTSNAFNFHTNRDYLSPLILRYFSIDILRSIIPVCWKLIPDRHRNLEKQLEYHYSVTYNSHKLSKNFLNSSISSAGSFIVATSYHSQKQQLAIYSPLKIADSEDIIDLYQESSILLRNKILGVPFSTAITQSARFPFVSPKGYHNAEHVFKDAGFIDNLGGSVSQIVLEEIRSLFDRENFDLDDFNISVVILNNSIASSTLEESDYSSSILKDVYGVSSKFANEYKLKELERVIHHMKLEGYNVNKVIIEPHIAPNTVNYPLGWFFSEQALNQIHNEAMNEASKKLDEIYPVGY